MFKMSASKDSQPISFVLRKSGAGVDSGGGRVVGGPQTVSLAEISSQFSSAARSSGVSPIDPDSSWSYASGVIESTVPASRAASDRFDVEGSSAESNNDPLCPDSHPRAGRGPGYAGLFADCWRVSP